MIARFGAYWNTGINLKQSIGMSSVQHVARNRKYQCPRRCHTWPDISELLFDYRSGRVLSVVSNYRVKRENAMQLRCWLWDHCHKSLAQFWTSNLQYLIMISRQVHRHTTGPSSLSAISTFLKPRTLPNSCPRQHSTKQPSILQIINNHVETQKL